jgi:hypothetical protein
VDGMTPPHNRKDTVKTVIDAAEDVTVQQEEAWSELERELQVRVRVYDKWVAEGKLAWADARDRLARMQFASRILKRLCDGETLVQEAKK